MNEELCQQARQYKEELVLRLFGAQSFAAGAVEENQSPPSLLTAIPPGSNIVGFGFGTKYVSGGGIESGFAVRVYVRSKRPRSALSAQEVIPSEVNGTATDVVVVGDIRSFARPTPCGVSVGHFNVTAGTLGCLVRKTDGTSGEFILSNTHILANENNASIGDSILQPGKRDGGTTPTIAKLSDFEPLNFSGGKNFIDAAIAQVINSGDVLPNIQGIGRVGNSPMAAFRGQSVEKHGRTTFLTQGIIDGLAEDIAINYLSGRANLEDQITIRGTAGGNFSDGGDSGSLIVDTMTNRPIALLVGGGTGITVACPISPVLRSFGIEIL